MSRVARVILLLTLFIGVSAALPANASAQVRRVYAPVHRTVVVRGYVGSPFWFYDPWYGDYGYEQWGPYPYPYPYPYPHRYYGDPVAAVRLEVKPKEAEVYVDGYYAGIVDDFDGTFQRLRLPPGEHEIVLYLDGYRTVHQKVYLTPDNTFKLKYAMEHLGAGDTPEPRPEAPMPPPQAGAMLPPPQGPGGQPPAYPPARGPMGRRPPQQPQGGAPPPMGPPPAGAVDAYGTLAVRVQPGDADVLVDGEKWRGPEGQERLLIQVPEGRHTVEIQKPGFRSYMTDIDVRRGETTPLNVSLRSQEEQ